MQDTPSFCREVLCCPQFSAWVDARFRCWGGDLRQREAFQLSSYLQVSIDLH